MTGINGKMGWKTDGKMGWKTDGKMDWKTDGKMGCKIDGKMGCKIDGKMGCKIDGKMDWKTDGMIGKRVIVIGAGASGLMAAVAAAEKGHQVTVLEKNEKAGKKIYITGKGRCNLTNDCATEDFFSHVSHNHKFLYSAVYGFDHDRAKDFFVRNGCPVKVERGNRVFPVSDHASDVTAALLRRLKALGGRICYRTAVAEILADSLEDSMAGPVDAPAAALPATGKKRSPEYARKSDIKKGGRKNEPVLSARGVRLSDGREMEADAVVLCTGGLSYPSTGATGDGYAMARQLGLSVKQTSPSLVPFETKEPWCRDLQGLALKNVSIKVFPMMEPAMEPGIMPETAPLAPDLQSYKAEKACEAENSCESKKNNKDKRDSEAQKESDGKKGKKAGKGRKRPIYQAFGELLFTHFGISGPIILTASCYCDFLRYPQGFRLSLDLKPALTQEQLAERLHREFAIAPDRHLPGAVRPLFPARLAEAVAALSGLPAERRAASFSDSEIEALAGLIKDMPITATGTRGYAEAIITRGGIDVREVNPSTMESRRVRGLFVAGEVLDVDAETGGYNLQIAWSTGHLAGDSI